jgi:hypothetical protein
MLSQPKNTCHLWFMLLLACISRPLPAHHENTTDEFVDNYDLNGDYAAHIHRVDGMKIWNQFENGLEVRGWAPMATGKMGTLVLRYAFEKPIESCSIRCFLKIWRDDDEVSLAVSQDDLDYKVLTNKSLLPESVPPYRQTPIDLTEHVRDSKVVYIRLQMRGTQLNSHIMTPEFLRTAKDMDLFNAPNVFEFRAK